MRWISGLIVGIGLVAVLVGGCGGGDETSSQLTKAEFTKQGDEICAERKAEWQSNLASFEKKFGGEKNRGVDQKEKEEEAEKLLQGTMLPALVTQLESLEDLGAPEGKEKQFDAMVKSLSKTIEGLEKDGVGALIEGEYSEFEEKAKDLSLNCPL